jgi:hypothetical protein
MTAPYPAPGEFPNFEQVLIDLLEPIATTLTALPASGTDIQNELPFFWARLVSGSTDTNGVTYTANVRIVAVAETRTAARELAAAARTAVLSAPGAPVDGVLLDHAEEADAADLNYFPPTLQRSQGAADLPNLDPIHQLVEIGFTLHARRQ